MKTSKEKGGIDSIQTAKLKSFIACLARQWANLLPSPSMRVNNLKKDLEKNLTSPRCTQSYIDRSLGIEFLTKLWIYAFLNKFIHIDIYIYF